MPASTWVRALYDDERLSRARCAPLVSIPDELGRTASRQPAFDSTRVDVDDPVLENAVALIEAALDGSIPPLLDADSTSIAKSRFWIPAYVLSGRTGGATETSG